MLEAALWWARKGVAVFPVWGVLPDGRCRCGAQDCEHPGKHPHEFAPRGFLNASRDRDRIRDWFTRAPLANIGGLPQGIVVLDEDGDEGRASLDAWQASHGTLPRTFTVKSGREGGGRHLFWRVDRPIMQRPRLPYVDVKVGGKGYVVLAPSLHRSGRRYAIVDRGPVVDAPPALLALIDPPRPTPAPVAWDTPTDLGDAQRRVLGMLRAACRRIETAGRGVRHHTLVREAFNIGGYCAAVGVSDDQVAPHMIAAGRACGADDPERNVLQSLADGRRHPRPLPPNSSTYRGTHAHQ